MSILLLSMLAASPAGLVVEASGFQSSQGHALARLYRPGMKVTGEPALTLTAPIVEGAAHFEFAEVPYGQYAVVVVHDRNDNGTIDHGALGLPVEPLGFSGGFTLGLFSGMPTFEKLAFTFAEGSQPQRIVVR